MSAMNLFTSLFPLRRAIVGTLLPLLVILAITTLILSPASLQAREKTPGNLPPALQLLDQINQQRLQRGCPALRYNTHLTRAAQSHLDDMLTHRYLSHVSRDGSTLEQRIARADYAWNKVGENIAAGLPTAPDVMAAWMQSERHTSILFDCAFLDAGIAYRYIENDSGDMQVPPDSLQGPFHHYWVLDVAQPTAQ